MGEYRMLGSHRHKGSLHPLTWSSQTSTRCSRERMRTGGAGLEEEGPGESGAQSPIHTLLPVEQNLKTLKKGQQALSTLGHRGEHTTAGEREKKTTTTPGGEAGKNPRPRISEISYCRRRAESVRNSTPESQGQKACLRLRLDTDDRKRPPTTTRL